MAGALLRMVSAALTVPYDVAPKINFPSKKCYCITILEIFTGGGLGEGESRLDSSIAVFCIVLILLLLLLLHILLVLLLASERTSISSVQWKSVYIYMYV